MARPKFRRYLSQEWELERIDAGMTPAQVVERTEARYRVAIARGFTDQIVVRQRLDDPFLSDNQHEAQLWIAGRSADKRNSEAIQ